MTYGHHFAVAALIAGFGLAASAQQTAPGPQGGPGAPGMTARAEGHGHGRHDPARMQERMAKRMAALKQKLGISSAQEGAWATWTSAMQPPANMRRPDRAEFAGLTTPERIDRMRALRTERAAAMDRRGDATKTFYAALTPQQQKVFDENTLRGKRGGRMGHHHRG